MKTAEEKAKELVELFSFECVECDFLNNAKQCAITCVEEIINFNKTYIKKSFREETNDIVIALNNTNKYWQEVKQKINEL